MTKATELLDALNIQLSHRIDNIVPDSDDPLEGAGISVMDLDHLPEEMAKVWNGTDAASLTLHLNDGADFQVHVIRVPPHMVPKRKVKEKGNGTPRIIV